MDRRRHTSGRKRSQLGITVVTDDREPVVTIGPGAVVVSLDNARRTLAAPAKMNTRNAIAAALAAATTVLVKHKLGIDAGYERDVPV